MVIGERDLWATVRARQRWSGPTGRASPSRWWSTTKRARSTPLDGTPSMRRSAKCPRRCRPGSAILANESIFEYGSRAGVWRFLESSQIRRPQHLLRLRAALGAQPPRGPGISAQGHDICGHGDRWEEYFRWTGRPSVRRCIAGRVDQASDRRARAGLVLRYGPSVNTRELVVEHGGFRYDSNAYNDDLPYYTERSGQALAGRAVLARGQRHQVLARRHEPSERLLRNDARQLRPSVS